MAKMKYEKPETLDASQVAAIQGNFCSTGTSATDACRTGNSAPSGQCIIGNDPVLIPACQPSGATATGYCGNGTTNNKGNCESGGTARGCYSFGTVP